MPSIDFELPHWLYWASLILFPLVAMIFARRGRSTGYNLPLAYFILATGGILGLHRFYLKNLWGLLYIPLLLGILFSNAQQREARVVFSGAQNELKIVQAEYDNALRLIEGADERLDQLRADLEAAEPGGFRERFARQKLEREEAAVAGAQESLTAREAELDEMRSALTVAQGERTRWDTTARWLLYAILAFMAVDAVLLPTLRRRAEEKADLEPEEADPAASDAGAEARKDYGRAGTGWTGAIDRLSYYSGEFVSYWAVIAVFVYYYEVVARYVFNSPTNWAHEGMYLMFGMQYLISGAYAMMTDSHVRVDIFYANWSKKRKAWTDLVTSIFFFIFAGTIFVTGWIFAWDATEVSEISFSEWAIAYWPFKWAIMIGGLLLVLQGVAQFARDLRAIRDAHAEMRLGA